MFGLKHLALTPFLMSGFAATAATTGNIDSRLVEAARNQDQKAVRTLVAQKTDVNAKSSDGSTALLWAAHWSDMDSAKLLLDAGADANAANDFRMTPLSEACLNANSTLVRLLLKSGAKPNTPIATGETPIMTCAKTGSVDAVRMLVEYGAAIDAREPKENQTALMWAASENHPDVVKALIELHADPKAHSKQGFTPIHFAAREGDQAVVETLLTAGVDVNVLTQADPGALPAPGRGGAFAIGGAKTQGSNGYTPLLVATVRAQVPLALWLLDHGADPNVGDAGITPLHWASTEWETYTANRVYGVIDPMGGIPDRKAKLQLVNALIAHGANVNARMTKPRPSIAGGYEDSVGATPLLLAASTDDLEMMKILVKAGADPKIKTATNASSLMAATGLNHGIGESPVTEAEATAAVNYLLELGVEPKGETTFNENALFGPAYRGWNTLLAQLIDLGVNVNAVSKAGVTPWLAAAGYGDRLGGVLYNKEGADLLEKHGADPKLGHPCEAQNKCRPQQ
ncbi:MAG TPA: ankyrin repeat domain-containing protein [Bryobacteraceae bacterium]|nr:ankyrin repeat domain-containing protein [Bryobacteraceae bacterium]